MQTGRLPQLRILSNCRCPAGYPSLNKRDESLCIANPGTGRPGASKFRISPQAYPPELVNDGRNDSKWISKVGQQEVSVTLTLNQTYEVCTSFMDPHLLNIQPLRNIAFSNNKYVKMTCQRERERDRQTERERERER